MKKQPQTEYHTLLVIVACMQGMTMQEWWEIMDITIPNLSTAIAVSKVLDEEGHEDPYDAIVEIENEYIHQRAHDVYEVWWPEHCIHRYFNSDATYCLEKSSVSS